jgi:integrase
VTIPPPALDAIKAHLRTWVAAGPESLLMVRPDGTPVSVSHLRIEYGKAATAIGRSDLTPYSLRHTGLTLVGLSGATVSELMHRGGHSSVAVAMRYQHQTADRDKALAELLGTMVVG